MGEGIKYSFKNTSISKDVMDEYDSEWAVNMDRTLTDYVTTPIAVTGVILNILVLISWMKHSPSIKSLVTLFRAIGVADIVFISAFCVWYHIPDVTIVELIFKWITFTGRNVVVNVTSYMSLIRWATIVFPFKFRPDTFEERNPMALGIIVAYCAIAELLRDLDTKYQPFSRTTVIEVDMIINEIVLSLPVVLQIVLSAHLLWTIRKLDLKPKGSAGHEGIRKMPKSSWRNTRLSLIVVSITATTFLSYPVGITASYYFKLKPANPKSSNKRLVIACVYLAHVLNSSINFFIYWAFMPQFRVSLMRLLPCCPDYTLKDIVQFHTTGMTTRQNSLEPTMAPAHMRDCRSISNEDISDKADYNVTKTGSQTTIITVVTFDLFPKTTIPQSANNTTTSDYDSTTVPLLANNTATTDYDSTTVHQSTNNTTSDYDSTTVPQSTIKVKKVRVKGKKK